MKQSTQPRSHHQSNQTRHSKNWGDPKVVKHGFIKYIFWLQERDWRTGL